MPAHIKIAQKRSRSKHRSEMFQNCSSCFAFQIVIIHQKKKKRAKKKAATATATAMAAV